MARAPDDPPSDLSDVVAKLRHSARRLLQTVELARASEEAWWVLANRGDVRKGVAASPANEAAWLIERALRDAQVVIVTRVFDPPSRFGALRTNRISFPVCRDLLALPGVAAWFIEDAWNWPNPADNPARIAERIERFWRATGRPRKRGAKSRTARANVQRREHRS